MRFGSPSSPAHPASARRRRLWLLGAAVGALALARLRGTWEPWIHLHEWLARRGVPREVRNLDAWMILLAVPLVASLAVARRRLGAALGGLGLAAPAGRALLVALLSTVPMFAAGALSGAAPRWSVSLLHDVALAPFAEEVFFRGLLCAVVVRYADMRFWSAATVGGTLFGLSHVSWTAVPTGGTLAVFLVTGAGGVWYAWLLRRWRWNLWVPIFLHATMNLSWLLFGLPGGALGGLGANLGRAATVALATAVTLRHPTSSAGEATAA